MKVSFLDKTTFVWHRGGFSAHLALSGLVLTPVCAPGRVPQGFCHFLHWHSVAAPSDCDTAVPRRRPSADFEGGNVFQRSGPYGHRDLNQFTEVDGVIGGAAC